VASRAAVPLGSLGRWGGEPGAERRIFVILSILPIPSKQFPEFIHNAQSVSPENVHRIEPHPFAGVR
jgi:hypothetical protein